ncbi:MAG: hypothetical protein ACOVOD_03955 [Rhodoferax sp.]
MRPIVIESPKIWVPHNSLKTTSGVSLVVTRVGRKSDTFTLNPGEIKGDYISFTVPTGMNLKQGRYDGILTGPGCQKCIPLRAPCIA